MMRIIQFNTLIICFTLLVSLTGCQPQGPTMMEALAISHYSMLDSSETQQQYFRQNIRAGMTKDEVKNLVIRTSQIVERGLISDGQPTNISFEVINNTTYEFQEYSYYSKVFALTFQDDRLIRFTEKKGKTVMDNM